MGTNQFGFVGRCVCGGGITGRRQETKVFLCDRAGVAIREHRKTEGNQDIVISVSEGDEESRRNRTVVCCGSWCGAEGGRRVEKRPKCFCFCREALVEETWGEGRKLQVSFSCVVEMGWREHGVAVRKKRFLLLRVRGGAGGAQR